MQKMDALGNISLGSISLNDFPVTKLTYMPPNVFYRSTNMNVSNTAKWIVEGKNIFTGFAEQLEFPHLNDSLAVKEIKVQAPFILDLKGFISNYDSVVITVKGTLPYTFKKAIVFPQYKIEFRATELEPQLTYSDV